MFRKFLILLRLMLSPFFKDREQVSLHFDKSGQEASDYIRELLLNEKPVMICRFGSTELTAIVNYKLDISFKNALHYITKKIDSIGYGRNTAENMYQLSGFFPADKKNLEKFSRLMIEIMPMVDVLGSWRVEEKMFEKELTNAVKVPLPDLEPYFHLNPWSEVLEGKKVLVIHPFEDSILLQYEKYNLLFEDKRVLPHFHLETIKAVQSLGNTPSEFSTWFDALDYMKNEIDKRDFDIAIIGCGAYGFPLAAYVKSIGKKAVHLGGATQMLFGIKSKAWEEQPQFQHFINKYWVRPKDSERPANFEKVENGRYW